MAEVAAPCARACVLCCGGAVATGGDVGVLLALSGVLSDGWQVLIALGAVHAGVLAWFVATPKGETDPG
jgi:hypothetical protein